MLELKNWTAFNCRTVFIFGKFESEKVYSIENKSAEYQF